MESGHRYCEIGSLLSAEDCYLRRVVARVTMAMPGVVLVREAAPLRACCLLSGSMVGEGVGLGEGEGADMGVAVVDMRTVVISLLGATLSASRSSF